MKVIFISNAWLSSGAAALSAFCSWSLGYGLSWGDTLLVFLIFMAIYNLHGTINSRRGAGVDEVESIYNLSIWPKVILVVSLLCILWILMFSPMNLQAFCGIFIVLGLGYGMPLKVYHHEGKEFRFRPKDIPLIKPLAVSIAITCVLILVPVLSNEGKIKDLDHWLTSFIFLHVLCNVCLGDIRDIPRDIDENSRTPVAVYGVKPVVVLLLLLLGLWCGALCVLGTGQQGFWPVLITTFCTLFSLILGMRNMRRMKYHTFDLNHYTPLLVALFF